MKTKNWISLPIKLLIYIYLVYSKNIYGQEVVSLGLESESVTSIVIDPKNANTIFAGSSSDFSSGKSGGIFKSTNNGIIWDTLLRGVSVTDIKINPINSDIIFASLVSNAKFKGIIIKSTDAGLSWSRADSGVNANSEVWVQQLEFVKQNPEIIYCYTSGFFPGKLYRSINAGIMWTKINESSAFVGNLHDLVIEESIPFKLIAINNALECLVQSNDSGKSWQEISLGKPLANILKKSDTTNNLFVLVTDTVEKPSVVYKSSDHGNTWIELPGEIPDSLYSKDMMIINRMNKEEKYVITNKFLKSFIYVSIDNNQWMLKSIFNFRITKMCFHPAGFVLATGLNGIYKIDGLTSISRPSNISATMSQEVNISVYPNPFNSATQIVIKFIDGKNVAIKIFDLIGREILKQTFVDNGYDNNLSYTWNGVDDKGLSVNSGIYFLQVQIDNQFYAKKIIYLK